MISTAAGFGAALLAAPGLSQAAAKAAPDLSVVTGGKIHKRVKKALDMLGGMSRFVKKDDVVVVKPNIGWDKEPKFAANTNPWVVAAVVRLCLEAGAKKVKVFDRPCQTAARCYKSSGIEEAAKKAGAEVSHTVKSGFVKVKLPDNARVLGLFSVVDMRGAGEVAEGELMRFFAEAAWYPTALLPNQGVRWEAADARSARATLTEGDVEITMLFTFDERGLVDTVRAEARGRTVRDEIVSTPWRGRFWNYEEHGGMLVPLDGEVAWVPPEGEKPYWRGHITEISYEFAR